MSNYLSDDELMKAALGDLEDIPTKTTAPVNPPKPPVPKPEPPVPPKKPVKGNKPPVPPQKPKKSKKGFIIGFFVLLAIAIAIALIMAGKTNSKPNEAGNYAEGETYVDYIDANAYFEENSSIQQVIPVSESQDVMAENEVLGELEARGFGDCAVGYEYDIDGMYYGEIYEVDSSSNEKHPEYSAYYQAADSSIWAISIINNQFIATPLSYTMDGDLTESVALSETEAVTSYDCAGNDYYVTIPNDDVVKVLVVDRLDASTLDGMTAEVINNA